MNKYFTIAVALCSVFAGSAADVVLPEGMIALTPEGVELTSEGIDNITQNKKPIVKTDNNLIFFTAKTAEEGDELWVSGLTPETTKMVKDINIGAVGSNPSYLTVVGNKVYFVAETSEAGAELWVSDGTEAGTKMVKDIYPGEMGSSPFGLSKYQDKVMFFAMDEESEFVPTIGIDPEKWLWISDGTEEGTIRLGKNPTRQNNYDGDAGVIVEANGLAFYVGYNLEMNETLYVSDGTPEGTKAVKNINPKATPGESFQTASAAIDWLTPVNNKWVVFRAETVAEVTGTTDMGSEIWVSDGTAEGTKWMSATSGTGDFFTISFIAAAASAFKTASLTISQPAFASSFICLNVASTSHVSVLHIDCTLTGASPPTLTFPIFICFDLRLSIMFSCYHKEKFIRYIFKNGFWRSF